VIQASWNKVAVAAPWSTKTKFILRFFWQSLETMIHSIEPN
jgi:hypothetical protein